MFANKIKFAAFFAVAAMSINAATAQVLPLELKGNYTHDGEEQCGSLRIEDRIIFSEDMGCEVLSIKRLDGEVGTASNFSISLSCQMDDPQKPKLSGMLSLHKVFDKWVLGVRLDVEPKLRRKFSYPPLQVFGKCSK
jgi:hypothetical protein